MNSIVDTSWLSDHLNDKNLVILDSSPDSNVSGLHSKFDKIRIKGARPVNIKDNFSDKNSGLPNTLLNPTNFQEQVRLLGININDTIIVYDNLGIYTSPRVWWMFKAMGHDNIAVLNGGLPEWVSHDLATEKNTILEYSKGNFIADEKPELIKSMLDVEKNISTKSAGVLDARSEGRFSGIDPEPRKNLRSGHIPNSKSLPFKKVLNHGKMKSKTELIEVFKELNLGDSPLIFSCGSGLTACIIYLAAEIALENKKALYDGSWTEWAKNQYH